MAKSRTSPAQGKVSSLAFIGDSSSATGRISYFEGPRAWISRKALDP
jgi:hypothetical protein